MGSFCFPRAPLTAFRSSSAHAEKKMPFSRYLRVYKELFHASKSNKNGICEPVTYVRQLKQLSRGDEPNGPGDHRRLRSSQALLTWKAVAPRVGGKWYIFQDSQHLHGNVKSLPLGTLGTIASSSLHRLQFQGAKSPVVWAKAFHSFHVEMIRR